VPHSSIDVEQIRERSRHAERRPSLPDLVPEAPFPQESELGAPGTGFCVKPSGGGPSQALRVYVKNTGDALADASTTRVEFDLHGDAKKPTSTIAGGGQEALEFPIPRGCYGSASTGFCKFKITVDSEGKVTESHETNNSVQSLCRVLPD
jgi:subtilase family serine protease